MSVTRECKRCRRRFEAQRVRGGGMPSLCSDECRQAQRRDLHNKARRARRLRRQRPDLICKHCGKPFPDPMASGSAGGRSPATCSPGCYEARRAEQDRQRKRRRKVSSQQKPRACRVCGTRFVPGGNGNGTVCSEQCRRISRRRHDEQRQAAERERNRLQSYGVDPALRRLLTSRWGAAA